jgi:L-serine/L-threonine ammonia-lyase
MTLHIQTPLFASRAMATDRNVWLKLEALQPSGSFKIRGIGLACEDAAKHGAKRFISSSGGNAGIAVAYAGRHLGVSVVVVIPETASERAKALIRQEGAEVIVHGPSWQDANAHAQSLVSTVDAFVHPFDDPRLWRGYSSMIDEVAEADVTPDAVVLSVGGGGLLCGVIEGMHRHGWSPVPVIAVETEGTHSYAQSMRAGRLVQLPAISSIATSLGARQVSERAFAWSTQHPVRSVVVPDSAAVIACRRFLDDHRLLLEPACGAALSVVYDRHVVLENYRNVLVIVCGGATTTLDQLQCWSQQYQ